MRPSTERGALTRVQFAWGDLLRATARARVRVSARATVRVRARATVRVRVRVGARVRVRVRFRVRVRGRSIGRHRRSIGRRGERGEEVGVAAQAREHELDVRRARLHTRARGAAVPGKTPTSSPSLNVLVLSIWLGPSIH